MEVERNLVKISPSGTVEKRPSITSSKFEIRKASVTEVELDSAAKPRSTSSKFRYRLADLLMNMLIVFPLSIGFWRGVWQLMEYYSRAEEWGVGPYLSIALGYLIPFFMYWYQEPLKRHVVPGAMNFVPFYIISRSLLLIHSFGSVNQWRGLWQLLDDQTGLGPTSALVSLVFGVSFNLILRTFSNVLAPPLMLCVDEAFTIHDCPLRFKTPPEKRWCYFMDTLFSVFIIPSLTVLCWRGVWNIADLYLYPEDRWMSTVSSLGFGYLMCIIICSVQPLICDFVYDLKGLVRLAVIDIGYMVGFVGCVFAWRGVWNSYNIFLIFETPHLSEWVTIIIGTIGTVLFGCVSTVMVRGITIDDELEDDEVAEWLIPYISHLRERHYNTPFPEPWVFRCLFTNQKMNFDKIKTSRPKRPKTLRSVEHFEGLNVPNSHGMDSMDATKPQKKSHIPHIDSSSEDDLGARESLVPNPELEESDHDRQNLHEIITMRTRRN